MPTQISMQCLRKNGMIFIMLIFSILFGRSLGWGYEEGSVIDGGVLEGRVLLKGAPPPARIFHLIFSPNIDFCIKISDGKGNRLLREFQASPDGGLKNAVVAVVGIERGKPFDYLPEITIENCLVAPFVTPVRNGRPFKMINKDPIAHDVQGYTLKDSYTFAMFNKPLVPESEESKTIRLRKGHYLFRTQCGVHDFMQSWGLAVGNPYFAVTGEDGRFTIPDLPPGEYDVIAWHPHTKVRAGQIKITSNGKTELNFEFDAAEISIPAHDLQEQFRMGTALQPHHLVQPSVELQRQ